MFQKFVLKSLIVFGALLWAQPGDAQPWHHHDRCYYHPHHPRCHGHHYRHHYPPYDYSRHYRHCRVNCDEIYASCRDAGYGPRHCHRQVRICKSSCRYSY